MECVDPTLTIEDVVSAASIEEVRIGTPKHRVRPAPACEGPRPLPLDDVIGTSPAIGRVLLTPTLRNIIEVDPVGTGESVHAFLCRIADVDVIMRSEIDADDRRRRGGHQNQTSQYNG